MHRILIIVVIFFASCSDSIEEQNTSNIETTDEGEWVYPTGKKQLLLDSWMYDTLTYLTDTNITYPLEGLVDSLEAASLIMSIRDKENKFSWAAQPKLQFNGYYKVDSSYTRLEIFKRDKSAQTSYEIILLSKDTLKLREQVDSLKITIDWTFYSLGNKF